MDNINSLMKKIATELTSASLMNYIELMKKKDAAYLAISNKNYSSQFVLQLDDILVQQLSELKYYSEKIERLERIIELIANSETGFSKEYEQNKKMLVYVLSSIKNALKKSFFHKNLLQIIEKQVSVVRSKDYGAFKRYYILEMEKVSSVLNALEKYPDLFPDVDALKSSVKKASIIVSRIMFFRMMLFFSWIAISSNLVLNSSNPYSITKPSFVMEEGRVKNLRAVMKEFLDKDMVQASNVESDFEKKTGINLLGEYRLDLLNDITQVLRANYENMFLPKIGIKNILFIDADISSSIGSYLFGIKTNEASGKADVHSGTMILNTRSLTQLNPNDSIFYKMGLSGVNRNALVFQHELAHFIHNYLSSKHPKFNEEWAKIHGGFLGEYAKTNIAEDVAVTASVFMWSKGNLDRHDNRYWGLLQKMTKEDEDALSKKLELLKKYNFFSVHVLD